MNCGVFSVCARGRRVGMWVGVGTAGRRREAACEFTATFHMLQLACCAPSSDAGADPVRESLF